MYAMCILHLSLRLNSEGGADKLKAQMEAIQQQMVEAKKNERANALKEVKRLLMSLALLLACLKAVLLKVGNLSLKQ